MPNKPSHPRPPVRANAEPSLDTVARVIARMLVEHRQREANERSAQPQRDG
ncbi:MAG TPA: hypothetical protein VLA05_00020 [Coriobacteriia bacterium]|nr:hypothetical protein [Coriobacteriia bacterium]